MISRLGLVLLFLTGLAFLFVSVTEWGYTIPIEKAVQADLVTNASPARVNGLVLEALERDDIEEADMYLEIATFLDYQLPESTLMRVKEAHELSATVIRNTKQFGEGFVTGSGDSTAGIAGAVTSDLTVIGDLRDIALEGGRMLAGQPYSELILGLSVVGVGVTAATIATGGGSALFGTDPRPLGGRRGCNRCDHCNRRWRYHCEDRDLACQGRPQGRTSDNRIRHHADPADVGGRQHAAPAPDAGQR